MGLSSGLIVIIAVHGLRLGTWKGIIWVWSSGWWTGAEVVAVMVKISWVVKKLRVSARDTTHCQSPSKLYLVRLTAHVNRFSSSGARKDVERRRGFATFNWLMPCMSESRICLQTNQSLIRLPEFCLPLLSSHVFCPGFPHSLGAADYSDSIA